MKTLKLLVVDDEPGIRSGIDRILSNYSLNFPFLEEDLNFQILHAATGEEGIDCINNNLPDIILLDNRLPGIQGVEVLEYIKQKQFDCRVAMITSYPSLDVAVKATDDGASDFIPKPFTPEELKSSISTITKQLFLKRITEKMKKEGKKVRFQFLSVLSHELKSPLNAILGYLDLMKNKQLGDNIDDYSEMIERSMARANGMKQLIIDLLDLTRIKFEKSQKSLQNVDLCEMAKYVVDMANPVAIQKDVTIEIKTEGKVVYSANPEDMEMIFNNLITNAIKYNKEGGKVICRLTEDDRNIRISVRDTGIGMTEDEVSKLFSEFVRIKNESTKHIQGTGLGLSIVKKISQLYEGNVTVESMKNVGSTFTVTLPKTEITNGSK